MEPSDGSSDGVVIVNSISAPVESRLFPTSNSPLIRGCDMAIKTRENLHVLQVKTPAGKASSGAVL